MKKLLTLLLCLLLSLGLVGCTNTTKKVETTETKETNETLDLNLSGKASDMNPEIIPPLQDIDTSEFYDTYRKLEKLIEEDNKDEAFKTFDELVNQMQAIEVQDTIDYIYRSENVLDDEITDIYNRSNSIYTECNLDVNTIGNKLVKKYGQDFKKHLNNDYFYQQLEEADNLDDEIITIQEEITKLQNEYLVLRSKENTETINYKGKDYTYDSLEEDKSLTKEEHDAAFLMLKERQNKEYGEVYLKLIEKNNELAKKYGFDSYPEYADKKIYGRDYTQDDLKAFYAAVKNVAKEYKEVDYEKIKNNGGNVAINTVGQLLEYMPKYAQETFADMVKNKLFVFGSGEQYEDTGYTYPLRSLSNAIIFLKLEKNENDIRYYVHELGHACEAYVKGTNSGYGHLSSYDVAETNSFGLQMLMADQYINIMDADKANIYKAEELAYIMKGIIRGCLFDEWQRKVYTTPNLTVDDLNNLFEEVYEQYSSKIELGNKYNWTKVAHNFTSPMYYISYATSAIVGAQIYNLAQTDRDKAVKAWESLIESGMSTKYMEAVKKAGLTPFNDVEATTNTIRNCIDEINKTLKELKAGKDYYPD